MASEFALASLLVARGIAMRNDWGNRETETHGKGSWLGDLAAR